MIRNVGGRVTPAVLDILDLLALGFPGQIGPAGEQAKGELIVLHHNQCGTTRMHSHPQQLAASFGIDPADLPAKSVGDPHASLEVDVRVLRDHPGISDSYQVTGMFYDVSTGRVQITVPARVSACNPPSWSPAPPGWPSTTLTGSPYTKPQSPPRA